MRRSISNLNLLLLVLPLFIPKSQLAILPGMTHVTLMMAMDQLMAYINPFLDKMN